MNTTNAPKNEQQSVEKPKKRTPVKQYFIALFGKYDIRNEKQLLTFGKVLLFIVLLVVEALIMMMLLNGFVLHKDILSLVFVIALEGVLTVSQVFKLFVVKSKTRVRILFYVLDAVCACGFSFFGDGTYTIVLYMLILTEFYIVADKAKRSFLLLCWCVPIYLAGLIVNAVVLHRQPNIALMPLLTQGISSFVYLLVHFSIVQIALSFYRQFVKLDQTLKALDESNKKLEEAYAKAKEVSALEERQRIAKDIHDTAGHSITTVIMQTESAKLIMDKNPEEAKKKIVSANLQAKHALEELRDSVHLLSGLRENATLQGALGEIIHESTDGTGITIRSAIEDVAVYPAKFRFLCNTLKEGISNGLRHGGATAFWFECREEDGKILFLLSDNGKGADAQTLKTGFGLTTTEQRVKAFGGELFIHTEAGEGFELKLVLPVDGEQEN